MKKIMFIALLVGLSMLYVFDNDMLDLADFKCQVVKRSVVGYPIRMCSIAFDDKGVIGKVADRL